MTKKTGNKAKKMTKKTTKKAGPRVVSVGYKTKRCKDCSSVFEYEPRHVVFADYTDFTMKWVKCPVCKERCPVR